MAQPITITIPHNLGKAEARARLVGGFDKLSGQLGALSMSQFRQVWDGDRWSFSAQALGQVIAGRVDVNEKDVRVEIDLPALLAGMASKIADKLRTQGRLLLEKK
jgi:hypothetical protein